MKMLTNEQITLIRAKMKEKHIFSATIARELNVTRQAVNLVLNGKGTSKRVEEFLVRLLNS